ncbi:MAG: amino acid ABC transporter substrate-binding protein [Betaproteobacteria bacterium]|jgi:ABC-type amino acid transport substrate-binding protein
MQTNLPRVLRVLLAAAGAALTLGAQAQLADGPTIKSLRDTGIIKLGYREASPPLSFKAPSGQPAGFIVEICDRAMGVLREQFKLPNLKVEWVPVTAENRFEALATRKIDLECGTTTVTLGRMERVDFSSFTFLDSGTMMVLAAAGMKRVPDVAGKRVAVVEGTTAASRLAAAIKRGAFRAELVNFRSGPDALAALRGGKVDAYANDRILLAGVAAAEGSGGAGLALLEDDYSVDAYALMMRTDDRAFRIAVNRGLSLVYGLPEFGQIFQRWFGPQARPSGPLITVYLLGSYGD